jgi:TRAP transporter TAXI family solute receptor
MRDRRRFIQTLGAAGSVIIAGCSGGQDGGSQDGDSQDGGSQDGGSQDGGSQDGGSVDLTFIGSTQEGFFTALGSSLAQVIREQSDGEISITVQTGSGAEANPRTIANSDPQLSATTSTKAVQAGQGSGPYESPLAITQFLTPVVSVLPFALTTTETDIDYLNDLSGKDFVAGPAGSSFDVIFEGYFKANDIGMPNMHQMAYSEGARAVAQGRMDAVVGYAPGGFPVGWASQWITQHDNAKLVVPESEQNVTNFINEFPGAVKQTLKLERFKHAWENSAVSDQSTVVTGGQAILLITDDTVPEEPIYRITKTAIENGEALSEAHAAWGGFAAAPETMMTTIINEAVPFHPGTAKAMREKGFWKDSYSEYSG